MKQKKTWNEFKTAVMMSTKQMIQLYQPEINIVTMPGWNGIQQEKLEFSFPEIKNGFSLLLAGFYQKWENGEEEDILHNEILKLVQTYSTYFFLLNNKNGYELFKKQIFGCLVNRNQNRHILSQLPNRQYLDLSFICKIDLELDFYTDNVNTCWISEAMLHRWGISEEELFQTACKNMKKQTNIISMVEVLRYSLRSVKDNSNEKDILTEIKADEEAGVVPELYVITNRQGWQGAGQILLDEVLQECSRILGGSFYLLPSNIHEFLAVAAKCAGASELYGIVKEINRDVLRKEDYLSDHVYYFDAVTEQVSDCIEK